MRSSRPGVGAGQLSGRRERPAVVRIHVRRQVVESSLTNQPDWNSVWAAGGGGVEKTTHQPVGEQIEDRAGRSKPTA